MFSKIFMLFFLILNFLNIFLILIPSHYFKFHPLTYGIILFNFTMMISLNLSKFFQNYWFSYITFLILIGGLMIIFLYFTSFISNSKFFINWDLMKFIPFKNILFLMFFMFYIFKYQNLFPNFLNFNEIEKFTLLINNLIDLNNLMFIFLNYKFFNLMVCMLYMLICLTFIVKICINKKFSMRKIN
uniref:NADH dehydrogenase subunit 6 n=1 Tax=Eupelmus sp. ZJUH_2016012 TaxID=2491156 RepID=A0A3S8V0K4_9HYME|nr:NADH dehydrogenase subunit 6 [Eupelmus sp. ZJUH_2016012]